jgi:hypothetical protein
MRKFIIALVAWTAAGLPAHAQLDEKNPETQFRALSALAGGGHRCMVADAIDGDVAHSMANRMAGQNEQAKALLNQIYSAAKQMSCDNEELKQLLTLGAKLAQPGADGYSLAYLDQGRCAASEMLADARLYATYRIADMSEERKTAAADWRKTMVDHLRANCGKTWSDLGEAYSLPTAISVWTFVRAHNGSCFSDWAKTAGPFDCVYNIRPIGPAGYDDAAKLARQSVRAARAKALAVEIETSKSCGVLTAAERAAGDAQARGDATFGLIKYNKKSKVISQKLDPDPVYATADEIIASSKALAKSAACADLTKAEPAIDIAEPELTRGEKVIAASGVRRIREALDRAAIIAASMNACEALPNFTATKTAAQAHVAAMTPKARLTAASESQRFLEELDRKACKADALGPAFKATPLFAVDALNGAWK